VKVSARPWSAPDGRSGVNYWLWCPGCDQAHAPNERWTYNGDPDRPTFTPSILVTGGSRGLVCHSFVTDGRIQFLGDCTHALAGETVDLPDVPDWLTR